MGDVWQPSFININSSEVHSDHGTYQINSDHGHYQSKNLFKPYSSHNHVHSMTHVESTSRFSCPALNFWGNLVPALDLEFSYEVPDLIGEISMSLYLIPESLLKDTGLGR